MFQIQARQTGFLGSVTRKWHKPPNSPERHLTLCWLAFMFSITAFVIHQATAGSLPIVGPALTVIGLIPCGWAWMLSRAIFRRGAHEQAWPILTIAAFYGICLVLYFDASGSQTGAIGYLRQIQHLMSSAMLVMTFVEAVDGIGKDRANRHFRLAFAAAFAGLVGLSFVVQLPEFEHRQDLVQLGLASLSLVLGTLAYQYRRKLFLSLRQAREHDAAQKRQPELARRVIDLLEQDKAFLDPDLKVADLAARLREPEYKVSKCITADLAFANFNQMINAHRIAAAQSALTDPDHANQSILDIAMACGFASLGPFNRAFKAMTGMTPSQYRRTTSAATVP